jgi:hypothetical protein
MCQKNNKEMIVHGEPCDGRSTYVFRKRQRGACHQENSIFEEKFYLGKYSILVLSGLQPWRRNRVGNIPAQQTHTLFMVPANK